MLTILWNYYVRNRETTVFNFFLFAALLWNIFLCRDWQSGNVPPTLGTALLTSSRTGSGLRLYPDIMGLCNTHSDYMILPLTQSYRIQRQDSNSGPFDLEAPALPSELPCFDHQYSNCFALFFDSEAKKILFCFSLNSILLRGCPAFVFLVI